jgi:methionine-rich copper-binding protein CopC
MGRIAKILGLMAILALLLVAGAVLPAAAEGVTVSISAPAEVTAGSDFTADINISEVTDFDACQYDISFDATVLRLDDVTAGEIDSTEVPVDLYNELSAGNYRVIQNISGLDGATGSGYLAVLHFHVIGAEGESSNIDLSNGVLSDITANPIEATWLGDTVSVSDFTAPTVASTSPASDETDVAVDTVVTATFSEAMDESTITTSSFSLDGVSGSVSYNSGSYTATFTPDADLDYNTTYTATLTTAITDAAGNPLGATYSWSFTTASIPPGTSLVSISAPTEVTAGSDFTANVNISSVTDFDACQYDVSFDATVLRLDDVTAGEIDSTEIPVDIYNELSAGNFRVVQNVPGLDGATGSGHLAVLHFHVIGAEGDVSTIDLSNGTLSNIQAQEITAVWVGDWVTITRRPSGGGGGGGGGAPPDTTAPVISGVGASNITKTSADIKWSTDEESDSQVEYWASPGVVTPLDTELVTEHIVHLDELTPGSNYYFKVRSTDEAGNLAESGEHTFTTLSEAAAFSTSQLSVSPSAVYVGETVNISVTVTNSGDAAGSYAVILKTDGVVEEIREITLEAGASEEVTFTTVKNVAGTYSVEVGGLSGSFIVEEKPVEPTTPPPTTPEESTINWPIIWGTMAGVLIVGVVILWLAIRRRAY